METSKRGKERKRLEEGLRVCEKRRYKERADKMG